MRNLLDEHDMMTRVAWHYYYEELTQKRIAEKMGISRFKVMDLLSKSKEQGIVQIKIVSPIFNYLSIENKLEEEFGLSDAVVIPTPDEKAELKRLIGIAGCNYLQLNLNKGETLGTAWGQTLYQLAKNFPFETSKEVSVVLMLGGLSSESISLNPFDVAKTLADKLGGTCYYIFSPAIVESKSAKKTFMQDKNISSALEMARSVNRAIVGIGETTTEASLVKTNFISGEKIRELKEKGAVGDILGRYFDIEGEPVNTEINDKIIGTTLEDLDQIDEVIGLAGGKRKIKSIFGALQGNYLDVLITDEETARGLLDYKQKGE